MKHIFAALSLVLVLVLLAGPATAEETLNVQLLRPSVFGGNFVSIDDSHTLSSLGFGLGLLVSYANSPFVYYDEDGEVKYDFINDLYTAHPYVALGTFSWASLGVEVPVHLNVHKRPVEDIATGTGVQEFEDETIMGDVLVKLKLRLLQQEKHWLGLALAPLATFPTGDETAFLGEGRITGGGNLILEHDFRVFNIGLNGGYLYRDKSELLDTEVRDAIRFGAGISRAFDFGLSFSIEYFGHYFDVEDSDKFRGTPMEALATLRYQFGKRGPRLIVGGGPGLSTSVGTPAYRVLGGIDYFYSKKEEPNEGELTVYTMDADGGALAADLEITGPGGTSAAESDGKWQGTVQKGDYSIKATRDGYESDSANVKVKGGALASVSLKLSKLPEPTMLKVRVTSKNTGYPLAGALVFDAGTDKEKTVSNPTGEFNAAFDPGAYELTASSPGFETKTVKITVVDAQANEVGIVLRQQIAKIGEVYFAYNSHVILPKSIPVLQHVVEQINKLSKFKAVIIEGHCSNEGSDAHNLELSRRRAMAVKNYLIGKGIDGTKLEIVGYGETRPIASNDTEEGRAENRRVEFIIEK